MDINWSDPQSKISKYFSVHEATYLPSWGIHHIPSEEEKVNIVKWANVMDQVRDFLNAAISVHCWMRPTNVNCPGSQYHGKDYNAAKGGAHESAHIKGIATDFDVDHKETTDACNNVRDLLKNKLEELNMRMENRQGPWIHLDGAPVKTHRYFIP